jgi:hypothetical protein
MTMANETNVNGGSKGHSSMQVQLRQRRALLSRASTLAIIAAAAGGLGSVQQAQAAACAGTTVDVTNATSMPLTGNIECVRVNTTIAGDIVNEAIVGSPDPGVGYSPFFVGKGGIVNGEIWNKAVISGGHPSGGEGSGFGAITIANGGQVLGGIRNTGQITSGANNAIQIGTSGGETSSSGTLAGGITNSAAINGLHNGIAALYGDFSGGLTNNENGVISGGDAGVYVADSFDSWSGGISNNGSILGVNGGGIQIGVPGATNVDFSGGIYNDFDGEISSVNGPAIFASGNSYAGGLTNYGLITETGETFSGIYGGAGVVFDAESVSGDIYNYGTIEGLFRQGILVTDNVNVLNSSITNTNLIDGAEGGVIVRAGVVNGNFNNMGLISGGFTGVSYSNNSIHGPGGEGSTATFTNSGAIFGGEVGFEVWANTVEANFSTGGGEGSGVITGQDNTGVLLNAGTWTGNVTNTGTINGGEIGLATNYDPFYGKGIPNTFNGNIQNDGTITGGSTGALIIADSFTGNFTNNGTIVGGYLGVGLMGAGTSCGSSSICTLSLGGGSFEGEISNTGVMSGSTAFFISYDDVTGNISNSGTLLGLSRGLYIDVEDLQGNITNTGTIIAPGGGSISSWATAIQIGNPELVEGGFPYSEQVVTGNITNTGTAHGGDTGLSIVLDEYFSGKNGGFSNSGTIIGDDRTGVYVNVNGWNGNFTNEAGGYIEGGIDGAVINA